MTSDIFLSVCAIAGTAVLWRNWIEQHPRTKSNIEKKLGGMSPLLLCGSCFTYWLALGTTIIHAPLGGWAATFPSAIPPLLAVGIQWMALGYLSVLFRFSYVLIQEYTSILVHNHDHTHTNTTQH